MCHTLVGVRVVQVAEVASGRSSPSELHSGHVSTHTHSSIDEVESTSLRVIGDLKMRLDDSFVRSGGGDCNSQSIGSRR